MAIAHHLQSQVSHSAAQRSASLAILAAACLILLNALLHASVYGNRNYRDDELYVLRLFSLHSYSALVQETVTDTELPGWRLIADVWVDSFGQSEEVTHWLSKLFNLVTFALVYQLGKHICCARVGLYAIVLLGVYGFAASGINELRPYPMLVMLTTALHLVFYRWLQMPTGRLMIAYCLLGMAALYTHYYAIPIFLAHAFFLIAFRRFERKFYLDSFVMWFLIALSFAPWIFSLLYVIFSAFPGGYYAVDLPTLVQALSFHPVFIFQFLVLLSLAVLLPINTEPARGSALRWYPLSKLIYPLFLLLATFAVALLVNSVWTVLIPQGFLSVVMLIALIMALGLWLLPAKAGTILLILLLLHAPQNIDVQTTNAPYRDIVQAMTKSYETDSIVVTEFSWAWRWLLGAAYNLMDFTPDKMSKERIFHLVEPRDRAHPPGHPDDLVNIHKTFDPEHFSNQLPNHNQLWHLQEGDGNDLGLSLKEWLKRNYAHIRTVSWDEEYVTSYSLSEYARVPDHDGPILEAGDNLRLYTWARHDSLDLAPCKSVTIESWWQIEEPDPKPYTISLILANEDGDRQLAIANSVPADQFTSDWLSDTYYRDRTTLAIPCDIGGGSFNLLLAAKETGTGKPLVLAYPGGDEVVAEFYLTTLILARN